LVKVVLRAGCDRQTDERRSAKRFGQSYEQAPEKVGHPGAQPEKRSHVNESYVTSGIIFPARESPRLSDIAHQFNGSPHERTAAAIIKTSSGFR
jgi:hypothetical protein